MESFKQWVDLYEGTRGVRRAFSGSSEAVGFPRPFLHWGNLRHEVIRFFSNSLSGLFQLVYLSKFSGRFSL